MATLVICPNISTWMQRPKRPSQSTILALSVILSNHSISPSSILKINKPRPKRMRVAIRKGLHSGSSNCHYYPFLSHWFLLYRSVLGNFYYSLLLIYLQDHVKRQHASDNQNFYKIYIFTTTIFFLILRRRQPLHKNHFRCKDS